MACGALAALVATAVTFPLEVVRRRAMGGQVHSPALWLQVQITQPRLSCISCDNACQGFQLEKVGLIDQLHVPT